MQTFSKKGRDGWQSHTDIKLEGDRFISIRTSKQSSGGIKTSATVFKIDGISIVHALYADYSQIWASDPTARCTDKTVAAQHASVLARANEIKAAVNAHYMVVA